MRGTHERTRDRTARVATAALVLLVIGTFLPATSSAAPSKRQQRIEHFRAAVAEARAKLDALNERESILDEQYLQAKDALSTTEQRLAAARDAAAKASRESRQAGDDLSARVKAAYEGTGSSLEVLLSAGSLSEFSDRLEFLDAIAADDSAAVDRATTARQRAQWAGDALAQALEDRKAALNDVVAKRAELRDAVAEQEDMLGGLEEKLRIALIPPPPPPPPPPDPTPSPTTNSDPPPAPTDDGGNGGGSDIPPPPAPSPRVQEVLDAAYSVLGTPYKYAGSTPEEGFDCSGFTMWSWAHGGVSLPHSSAMQYSALPHVDRSQLQPGDLLFFYSPIHHVAMYVGGDQMIHSPHTGGYVEVIPVYWQYYVGAARPG